MATLVKDVKDKLAEMTGKKEDLPAQLAQVRRDLEAARDKLGEAALADKPTEKLRTKVAELAAQEADLSAALRVSDFKLMQLADELDEAERAELVRVLQDTDARLMDAAEQILVDLYDLMDRAAACANEYAQVAQMSKTKNGTKLETGTLEMGQVNALFLDAYRGALAAVRGAELRFSLGGTPARFGKIIQGRRWTHRN